MPTIFVSTSDDCPSIECVENLNQGNAISADVMDILIERDFDYVFIIKPADIPVYSGLVTAGESHECYYTIINDSNIGNMIGKKIRNAILLVEDINQLPMNLESIIHSVSESIEIKFGDSPRNDQFESAVAIAANIVYQSMKTGKCPVVKNFNNYTEEKFSGFGEDVYFMSPDGTVYRHPSFYYQKSQYGSLGHISSFKVTERVTHFSKPHLVCMTCETFYCDRDIYHNKLLTGEYMVPCSRSCKTTTILSRYSSRIFNKISGKDILNELLELDRVPCFAAEEEYEKLLNNKCICNAIKGVDFSNRFLYFGGDHET